MTDTDDHALAIANLKALYCSGVDLAASDLDTARALLADVFADDFVGDYGYDPIVGPLAIVDFLCSAINANSEWALHMLHSPRIAVTGERAIGEWTVMAHLKRKQTGVIDIVLGRYSDRFRLTDKGWRIEKVTFARLQ